MSEAKKPEDAPGHYGAGYGEQVPADAPPGTAPKTDEDTAQTPTASAADTGTGTGTGSVGTAGTTGGGDDGNPVVFTPDDVSARPPDRPPTESAPESEKAGLIFERS